MPTGYYFLASFSYADGLEHRDFGGLGVYEWMIYRVLFGINISLACTAKFLAILSEIGVITTSKSSVYV